ncbi:MAG: DUF1643 domain-containing protein [Salinivirgaceae bacterium]|jgi:hypothetical protein|nr:DUF1643 domain-containing protein [Salinivirgaceae bacterium]
MKYIFTQLGENEISVNSCNSWPQRIRLRILGLPKSRMTTYKIDIYKNNEGNTARFALGINGKNPLLAVGLNPSTADDSKPDMTITKIMGFANRNGFDGFVMLNLYPQRATFQKDVDIKLNEEYQEFNWKTIEDYLASYTNANVLAAWGEPINTRIYLRDSLVHIDKLMHKYKAEWLQIRNMTKSGHPRHPSRAAYDLAFKKMEMTNYIRAL